MLIHLLLIVAFVSTCVCVFVHVCVCVCVCVCFGTCQRGRKEREEKRWVKRGRKRKKRATLSTLSIDILPQVLFSPPLFTPAMIVAIAMPSCIVRPQDFVCLVEQFPGVSLTNCAPL